MIIILTNKNPPSIPTFIVSQCVCFLRNSQLVIDWHNLAYSVLALRLGDNHFLVKLSKLYERFFAIGAINFCVSNAFKSFLQTEFGLHNVETLPDCPPSRFQPVNDKQTILNGIKEIPSIDLQNEALVVSATSWTSDEDFSILVDALTIYDQKNGGRPLCVVITGKGGLRDYYMEKIAKSKFKKIRVYSVWLSHEDYALLLGCADFGVSLHKSSSGLDLPMKIVDLFGAGTPVISLSFPA